MSDDADATADALVEAAHQAVEHPDGDSPKPHGDPLAAEVPTDEADPTPRRVLRARSGDTYGTADAARLLGLSDRRVRQLVAEGQLPGERDPAGVLRIPQQAVHAERARRRTPEGPPVGPGRKPAAAATDPQAIAAAVAAAVGEVMAGQRELTAQAHSLLDAERAHSSSGHHPVSRNDMNTQRLLVSLLIAFGPLGLAYAYGAISDLGTTGVNIGAAMILWPVMVITPFLIIAAVAYYFMDQ